MARAFSWLQRSEVKNLVYTGFIDDKSSEIAVSHGQDLKKYIYYRTVHHIHSLCTTEAVSAYRKLTYGIKSQ